MSGLTIQSVVYLSLLMAVYGCVGGGQWSDRDLEELYPVTCENYESDYPRDQRLDNIHQQIRITAGIMSRLGSEFDAKQQLCLSEEDVRHWLDGFVLTHCSSSDTFVGETGNQRLQSIFRTGLLAVLRMCGSQATLQTMMIAMQENLFRTRTLE